MGGLDKEYHALLDGGMTDEQLLKYEGAGTRYTFYTGDDFHVDNEGKTTPQSGIQYFNLQIQTVSKPKNTTIAKMSRKNGNKSVTVGWVFVEVEATPSAADLRTAFKESFNGTDKPGKVYIRKK
ncbi:MAG: hypothetical protein M1830_010735 [Pleopsidium flavum]|nr:MAG: hypothetical protein M1830_010735 [Pleopsidium flavum]